MSARMWTAVALAAAACGACNDATLPWQLDHDRIIAVRATPPHIPAQSQAALDVLVTSEAGEPTVVAPMLAAVVPDAIEPGVTVVPEGDGWAVIAPEQRAIADARAALGLPPDMPVPVQVSVTVAIADEQFAAIKTVYLGGERDNPALAAVTIGDQPASDGMIIPTGVDVALDATIGDAEEIDWFTSLGDLEDATDRVATLRADEPSEGFVAVVIRDAVGGVVWGLWALRASD